MSDIDRVFARMGGSQTASSEQHEQRRIPRRGGSGTKVVEVVRLTSRSVGRSSNGPRRHDPGVRAQTWDDGFPTKSPMPPALSPPSIEAEKPQPVGHVLSRLEPTLRTAPPPHSAPERPPSDGARQAPRSPGTKTARSSRRVADPFDMADDGANCLRCGYAIESAREQRGLTTCAECG